MLSDHPRRCTWTFLSLLTNLFRTFRTRLLLSQNEPLGEQVDKFDQLTISLLESEKSWIIFL